MKKSIHGEKDDLKALFKSKCKVIITTPN